MLSAEAVNAPSLGAGAAAVGVADDDAAVAGVACACAGSVTGRLLAAAVANRLLGAVRAPAVAVVSGSVQAECGANRRLARSGMVRSALRSVLRHQARTVSLSSRLTPQWSPSSRMILTLKA